jgi:hypothetical protein
MTTGQTPDEPAFIEAWEALLHELGHRLAREA